MHALIGTISGLVSTYILRHSPGLFIQSRLEPNIPALFVHVNEGANGQWYMITAEPIEEDQVRAVMACNSPDKRKEG